MKELLAKLNQLYLFLIVKMRLIQEKTRNISDAFFLTMSIAALGFVVYEFGYVADKPEFGRLKYFYLTVFSLYFIRFVYRSFFAGRQRRTKQYFLVNIIVAIVLFVFLYNHFVGGQYQIFFSVFKNPLYAYIFIAFFAVFDVSVFVMKILRKTFNPSQLFAFSFFLIISIGSGLLMLPNASHNGISFVDAVFVSTSAVCVTGLTPIDVSTDLTGFGQFIIIGLIQIGGLGIMTFTSFIGMFFIQKPSYENQYVIKGLLNQDNYINIFTTLRNIIFTTLGIEILGVLLVYHSIGGDSLQDLWFSVFHSISAFCNAGFSTLSENLYDVQVRTNSLLQFWIAFLIIIGGLGFPIIFNYTRYLRSKLRNFLFILSGKRERITYLPRIINVSTKIVLLTTFILLISGTIFFFVFEYNNTMAGLDFGKKVMNSFFLSVSARTAGFNSVPMNSIMPASALILILLMWIGASPSSTGGGIKTTTFAVMILNMLNIIRGKKNMEFARRRISNDSIYKASAIVIMSLFLIGTATLLLAILEPNVSLMRILVEVFSAAGTVGFSMDLTPNLSTASKYIIAATMFMGRIGMITILLMFARRYIAQGYTYPEENILIT